MNIKQRVGLLGLIIVFSTMLYTKGDPIDDSLIFMVLLLILILFSTLAYLSEDKED